jgi:guanylate kinase
MPEAVQVFIAPPDSADLRRRLTGRGTDDPEAIERRLREADEELAARDEFEYVVVNDEVQRAAGELERIVEGALSLDSTSEA